MNIISLLGFVILSTVGASSVYLPGVGPQSYEKNDNVKLFVSKLTSTITQMPYDYYTLPFCKPHKKGLQGENIGEVLSGDRIENSVYKVEMKSPKSCEVACMKVLKKDDSKAFHKAIEEQYRIHWIVDTLPVGMYEGQNFVRGFPVGFSVLEKDGSKKHFLNNHIRIIIQYHDTDASEVNEMQAYNTNQPENLAKIVGFRVEPMSVKHQWRDEVFAKGKTILTTCNSMSPLTTSDARNYQPVAKGESVVFSYDVVWEASSIEWANRWDTYVLASSPNDKVHWFAISNSIMIVLLLSVMIGMILLRALRKDIAKYNEPSNEEDSLAESGWKLCHGDVFRAPAQSPMLLSVFVGTGVQLFLMTLATLSFSLMGLLSPANRGSLTTAFILLFVFMGLFAGYHSSMTYKMFRGTEWKINTISTALFFPGSIFIGFFILNFVLLYENSSGAIPIGTFFLLMFLWVCVSIPLVFIGSFFGYKQEVVTHPVRTNLIPRMIPPQPWYMHPAITIGLAGVLPFGAVSVELFFIMSALWLHQIYYIFGFLFLVMLVLIVTCAEVAILLCYFQLCNEDYEWWWRAFMSSGSCGIYTFVYSAWYYLTELNIIGFVPTVIFFSYMFVISLTCFLVTGTIGFYSCLWFNRQIYGSIKVD